MRRFAILIAGLAIAGNASAIGITGTVLKTGGLPVWPCNIDIVNRQTGVPVILPNDSTLANGSYNLTLPDGRYDLTFKPKVGVHIFQGVALDVRVSNNTVVADMLLPLGKYVSGKVVGTNLAGVPTTNLRFKTAAGAVPVNVQDDGTNLDGTFSTLVDPNLWNFEVIPSNLVHKAPLEIFNVDVTTNDVVLGNVVVQDGFVLTCSVTDASFFPLANASIIARKAVGNSKMFTPLNNTLGTGVATIVLPVGNYNISAIPPPGTLSTYATASQYNVSPTVDATLPNFALPPARMLSAHVVAAGGPATVVNADIDIDKWLAPTYPRVETPNDFTDASGNFSVGVATGTYRVTINPPVATRLLPLRIDNVAVGATALNLGTRSCKQGHWVDITVVAQGTGVPIAGANIDVLDLYTQTDLITNGDVTSASGFARIVIDTTRYHIKVAPPSALYDTAFVIGVFRNFNDTAITVFMPRKGVLAVPGAGVSALRLAAPWPNPARAGMNFAFAGKGDGELEILDIAGRLVATPWHGEINGEQTARWEGRDASGRGVSNGIYFARLRIGKERSVQRVVVAR